MANTVQHKRGTTAQVNSYTGAVGEFIYNTTTKRIHAQDGATAGGIPHALVSDVDLKANASVTISAGAGLTGGGTLAANRTLALSSTSLASLALADSAVQSVNGKTGSSVTLTKADVGLSNVDNTSDANKPISTATQTALNAKANSSVTITAGAGLTGGGNLTANRTVALDAASIASLAKADTALQAPGGTTGQILAKNSGADNDVAWVSSEAATAVSYGPQTLTEAQQVQARQNIQADKSYDSIASVEAATVPAFANVIRTNGYYAAGDGGDALYKRVTSEPSHAGKVQSADGAWWEEVARQGTLAWYMSVYVPISQNVVYVTGRASPIDGGEGRYVYSEAEPAHDAKFKDAGGRWFEFSGKKIRAQHLHSNAGMAGFDATSSIQSALDYLEVKGGGELELIDGTYDISGLIRIPSKVKIVGSEGAILNRVSNTNGILVNKSDGSVGGYDANRNIGIRGITIQCNGAAFTTPCTPVAFGHARKISIRGISVYDVPGGWHAIELNAVKGAKVIDNILDGGGDDLDTGEAIQLDIMGSEFGFPWFGPYDHVWCEDIVIQGNDITNWAVGIGSHSVSSTPGGRHSNVKIRDNKINVSRHGITPYGWTRVSIKDNIITNYMRSDTTEGKNSIGINVTSTANNNCTAIRIRDNIIDGFERGGASENSRGINIGSPSDGAYTRQVSISGNFISNVKRHGIGVDYAQDVLVFGNRLDGIGQVGIYMFGSTKSSVRDNRIISGGAGYDDIIVNHGALPVGTLLDVIVSGNYCPRKMTANGTRIIVVNNIVGITTGSIDGTIINGTKAGNLVNGAWA